MMCALWHKSGLDMAIEGTHFPFTPVPVHVEPIPLFVQGATYWTLHLGYSIEQMRYEELVEGLDWLLLSPIKRT